MSEESKRFLDRLAGEMTKKRSDYEESLDWVATPGSTVHVLPDGRRDWMLGESGVVVWSDEQWAEVQFKGRGLLKFRLERISRQAGGKDCWHGRLESNVLLARTKIDLDF